MLLAPALAPAQAIAPWPIANTPHPAGARLQPEDDYTLQAPGRVPLTLHAGSVQHVVAYRRAAVRPSDRAPATHTYLGIGDCSTPCTLYVPPGVVTLRAMGPRVRETEDDVRISPSGAAVYVRSPSSTLFNLGVGLVGLGATAFVGEFVGILAAQARGDYISTPGVLGFAVAAGVMLAAGIGLVVNERTGFVVTTR